MDIDKALEILEDLKECDYEHCIKDLDFSKDKALFFAQRLYNHCTVVGNISSKIAKEIGFNQEKAQILGILHDIGRFNSVRFHGLTGYEIAMEKNLEDLARIALTHSFINDEVEDFHFPNNEFKEKDLRKTQQIFSNIKLDEYDYMVRIGDFMSIGDTLEAVSIEERLADIRNRYPMSDQDFTRLNNTISNLKIYWDKKLSCDLYKILDIK